MNKRTAARQLTAQKTKLENVTESNCETWLTYSKSIIQETFGEKSPEFSFISKYSFYDRQRVREKTDKYQTVRHVVKYKESAKEELKSFLEGAVETLELKGLFKPAGKNVFSQMSYGDLAAWLIPIATGLFGLGLYIGSLNNTNKIERYEEKISDQAEYIQYKDSSFKKTIDSLNVELKLNKESCFNLQQQINQMRKNQN